MLTKETVLHVSKLARLKLTESEITAISEQLSAVLENFEQISQVDTKGVRPLVTPTDMSVSMRADEAQKIVGAESMLENAPEKVGRLFKVPPVV